MNTGSKAQEQKIREQIRKVAAKPCNSHCVNCTKHSTYVVFPLNAFCCEFCADAHRSLGFQVKSIGQSIFTKEEATAIEHGGNDVVMKIFFPENFDLDDKISIERIQAKRTSPNPEQEFKAQLRRFIDRMYVQKMYFRPEVQKAVQAAIASAETVSVQPTVQTTQPLAPPPAATQRQHVKPTSFLPQAPARSGIVQEDNLSYIAQTISKPPPAKPTTSAPVQPARTTPAAASKILDMDDFFDYVSSAPAKPVSAPPPQLKQATPIVSYPVQPHQQQHYQQPQASQYAPQQQYPPRQSYPQQQYPQTYAVPQQQHYQHQQYMPPAGAYSQYPQYQYPPQQAPQQQQTSHNPFDNWAPTHQAKNNDYNPFL